MKENSLTQLEIMILEQFQELTDQEKAEVSDVAVVLRVCGHIYNTSHLFQIIIKNEV